jgi:hypothetical protein
MIERIAQAKTESKPVRVSIKSELLEVILCKLFQNDSASYFDWIASKPNQKALVRLIDSLVLPVAASQQASKPVAYTIGGKRYPADGLPASE